MIYFDNSATTMVKPRETIEGVINGVTSFSANPGRSGHKKSLEGAIRVTATRQKLARYFSLENEENIVFTSGCTESLNTAILGILKKNDHVIISDNEHNSTLRPLFSLQKKGLISVSIAKTKNGRITKKDVAPHFKRNTSLIITNHISNVNGDMAETKEIGELSRERNALYLVDGAQSAGHVKIDMARDNIDLLCLAGHKGLLGPQGIGALLISQRASFIRPLKYGGTGTNSMDREMPSSLPEKLESGTLSMPGILGLSGALDFVMNHEKDIKEKLEDLTRYCLERLNEIKYAKIYTSPENLFGVVAFLITPYDSSEISSFLNEREIYVRSGLHCAPEKHNSLNTTSSGLVRVSFSPFNTKSEIDEMIEVLKELKT